MAGPIGYVPPANPYAAMPIEQPKFTGINPMPGQAAAMQAMAPVQQKIQASQAYDDQAQKAAEFQKLLGQGLSGMQAYITDVSQENPELASHFTQEMQTMAPFMKTMKGKELNDAVFGMYDSWNGRYNGAKTAALLQQDPNASTSSLLGAAGLPGDKTIDFALKGRAADSQVAADKATALKAQADVDKATAESKYRTDIYPKLRRDLARMEGEYKLKVAKLKMGAGAQTSAAATMNLEEAQAAITQAELMKANLEKQLQGVTDTQFGAGRKLADKLKDVNNDIGYWRSAIQRNRLKGGKEVEFNPPPLGTSNWYQTKGAGRYGMSTEAQGESEAPGRFSNTGMQALAGQTKQAPQPIPEAGAVMNGYRFVGGDPNDPENWEEQ